MRDRSCPVCGKDIDTCGCGKKIRVDFSQTSPAPKVRVPSPEGFWRTRDGKFKAIAEMDDSYLANCIKMLEGRLDSGSRNKLNELKFEQVRRKNLEGFGNVNPEEVESISQAYQRYLRAAELERERQKREREQAEAERVRQQIELNRQRVQAQRERIRSQDQLRNRARFGMLYGRPLNPTEVEPAPEPPKPAEPEISVDPNKPERIIRKRRRE
jgi:hypothetical protein